MTFSGGVENYIREGTEIFRGGGGGRGDRRPYIVCEETGLRGPPYSMRRN